MRLLAAGILCLLASSPVFAQSSPVCEIKKILPEFVTSQIASSYSKKASQSNGSWLEVDVDFDFPQPDKKGPKFADDLTVNYYILLNNKSSSEDGKATLLTGSVSHTDIAYGKGLHSAAFVSPQSLARFFDGKAPNNFNQAITDIGVTISDGSGVIARKAFKSQVRGDKGWWDDTSDFTEVTGRVLSKDATPFAALAWDYYLPLKAK